MDQSAPCVTTVHVTSHQQAMQDNNNNNNNNNNVYFLYCAV